MSIVRNIVTTEIQQDVISVRQEVHSYFKVQVSTGSKLQWFIREAHKEHEIIQYIDLTQYTASEGMKCVIELGQ